MKDKVIKIIKERYPHYTGKFEFDKIAVEFKNAAKPITIGKKYYIYIMTKKRVIIEEVINKLATLSGLLPKGIAYVYNPDDTIIHLLIKETYEDYLRHEPIETLITLINIEKIIRRLKRLENKEFKEYYFADFKYENKISIRTLELKYKEKINK